MKILEMNSTPFWRERDCLYGVASVNRIDKIIGLFCKIISLLWGSFAKETYNFIDPTNRSHPILHIRTDL